MVRRVYRCLIFALAFVLVFSFTTTVGNALDMGSWPADETSELELSKVFRIDRPYYGATGSYGSAVDYVTEELLRWQRDAVLFDKNSLSLVYGDLMKLAEDMLKQREKISADAQGTTNGSANLPNLSAYDTGVRIVSALDDAWDLYMILSTTNTTTEPRLLAVKTGTELENALKYGMTADADRVAAQAFVESALENTNLNAALLVSGEDATPEGLEPGRFEQVILTPGESFNAADWMAEKLGTDTFVILTNESDSVSLTEDGRIVANELGYATLFAYAPGYDYPVMTLEVMVPGVRITPNSLYLKKKSDSLAVIPAAIGSDRTVGDSTIQISKTDAIQLGRVNIITVPALDESGLTNHFQQNDITASRGSTSPNSISLWKTAGGGKLQVGIDDDRIAYVADAIAEAAPTMTFSVSINAVQIGQTTLRASCTYPGIGSFSDTCAITVVEEFVSTKVLATGVSLSPGKLTLAVGARHSLKAAPVPANAAVNSLEYSSSNTSVASVSQSGVVTAHAPGSAKITVRLNNSHTATCDVTVLPDGLGILPGNGTFYAPTGAPFGQVFTPTGGTGAYTMALSGALPGGVTFEKSSAASYALNGMPMEIGTYPFQITVSDEKGNAFTTAYTLIVHDPLALTGAQPGECMAGDPVTITVMATGGVGPYTFEVSNGAPTGMSLSHSITGEGRAVFSGTPAAGDYVFQLTATDAIGNTASFDVALRVIPPLAIDGESTIYLPRDQPADIQLSATGGYPGYAFSATGNLPDGVTLSADGTLSGTATTINIYATDITVTDSKGNTASRQYTIIVYGPLSIAEATNAALTQGTQGEGKLRVSGGVAPYTFTYTGAPPEGMTGAAQGDTFIFSGVPTRTGSTTVDLTATDAAGQTVTGQISFDVASSLTVTANALSNAVLGIPYSATPVQVTGGTTPYRYALLNHPSWLVIDPLKGAISGTPTQAGSHTFTISVVDADGTQRSAQVALSVTEAASISPIGPFYLQAGKQFSQQFSVVNGSGNHTFAQSPLFPFPEWIGISESGTLTATPGAAQTGTHQIVVYAWDSGLNNGQGGHVMRTVDLIVSESDLRITTADHVIAWTDKPLLVGLTASGGDGNYTYSIDGDLPEGSTLYEKHGVYNPDGKVVPGVYSLNVTVTDGQNISSSKTITLEIREALKLPSGGQVTVERGKARELTYAFEGGSGEYEYEVSFEGGALSGVSIVGKDDEKSVTLKIPATRSTGTYRCVLTVKDKNWPTEQSMEITIIVPESTLSLAEPGSTLAAFIEEDFEYTFAATGGAGGYTYVLYDVIVPTAPLPAWMSFDRTDGKLKITGTPAIEDVEFCLFRLTVTDGIGDQVTVAVNIDVKVNTTLRITTPARHSIMADSANIIPISAAGGIAPYTFSVKDIEETIDTCFPFTDEVSVQINGYDKVGSFTLVVKDGNEETAEKVITIDTYAYLYELSMIEGDVGAAFVPYTHSIAMRNVGASAVWTVNGDLPPGIRFDQDTNSFEGTPTIAGEYSVTISVTNAGSTYTASQEYTFKINDGSAQGRRFMMWDSEPVHSVGDGAQAESVE